VPVVLFGRKQGKEEARIDEDHGSRR
jgi:hypothetical protein